MQKIYSKTGYKLMDGEKEIREVSRETIVNSITVHNRIKENIELNLSTLEADLTAIDNA